MLTLALLLRRGPTGLRLMVAVASMLTAVWAALATSQAFGLGSPVLNQFGTLHTAAWITVLLVLQRRSLGLDMQPTSSFIVAAGLGFLVTLLLVLDLGVQLSAAGSPSPSLLLLFVTSRLILAIFGLVLLHNLYANSDNAYDLNFRLLAVGIGILFAYDLNFYTLQFLTGQPNATLHNLRGAAFTLAVPFIYLGMRGDSASRITLSRRAAFHTVSFSIIGIYLILMSLLSYGLRLTGGNWGELLQILFITIALALGTLILLSPRFRAELKVRISRNFYRYRYDYRVEWLRFIDMIDAQSDSLLPFRERLIQAFANVLDSPGGALIEPDAQGSFHLTSRWSWPTLAQFPPLPPDAPVIHFLYTRGLVVDFDRLRAGHHSLESLTVADSGPDTPPSLLSLALHNPDIWLAVPVIHGNQLRAVLVLERSIVRRDLNWEDYDLLRTLGRQGGSYLAEADTLAQLEEARSFEEYNRRFAFVMHDVKNVVSQLALVARNAQRHADNPAFRADMVTTLNSSVTKMTDLLNLMSGKSSPAAAATPGTSADIARILTTVIAALRRQFAAIELDGAEASLMIEGDPQRLDALFTHLIQNAIDASTPDAPIRVALAADTGWVTVRVEDHGHGMSQAFIRDELFRPFHSTKDGGFGIGTYEAREIARHHGGQLDVTSTPGEGTTFTVRLPRHQPVRPRRAPASARQRTDS